MISSWQVQVIQAGSWGGIYFNPRGGRAGIHGPSVDVTHEEFPADWFEGLPVDAYRGKRYTKRRNKYGVRHYTSISNYERLLQIGIIMFQ